MKDSSKAHVIAIPGEVCGSAGVAASWVTPSKIALFGSRRVDATSGDEQSTFAACEANVHFLKPDVILFHSSLRKLVNESNGVFLSVQSSRSSVTACNARPEMLRFSKHYRSILRACIEEFQDCLERSPTDNNSLLYENFQTIFYNIECIWHLTEILHIHVIPGDVVLPKLLEWVRFHFPSRELIAMKILARKKIGADLENADYWEAVMGCALHGKLDIARALLAMHSRADHTTFVAAENALRSMPVFDVYGGYSVKEFTIRWKHWQLSLIQSIDSKLFAVEADLESLMKMIAGGEVWEFAKHSEAWYELLAAKLLYSAPCCKQPELARNANAIANKWKSIKQSQATTLDNIILALMESDLHQVIKEIQYMNDNGWFAAHLTNLLYNCGRLNVIDENQMNVTDLLHESLILEYGSTLMEHRSLWQCGASYLKHCPNQGLARLKTLLQTLPLGNETRVQKIISLARENGLDDVVSSICKIQGSKCMEQERMGNALAWVLKGHDEFSAAHVADRLLRHYAEHSKIQCPDLLENLGSCMLVCDRLTFLGKYCEFHQMYKIGEFKEAGNLLISLIVSRLTPKYFWNIILTDAIPLLECDDLVFSSQDTTELIRAIEAYDEDIPDFREKEQMFRLAAARNLSRALISEMSQPN